jgi:AcrR family transcriptional regulator
MPARKAALSPRKRPRQQRSEATVAVILEAAARILETADLDAINTNLIARRAGISVGSVYQYFPGKEAIYAALIERAQGSLADGVEAVIAATKGKSLALRTRALIDAAVAQQLEAPRLAATLDYLERVLPKSPQSLASETRITGAIAALLKEHRDDHRRRDYAVAARDIVAVVQGMVDAAGEAGERDAAALARRVTAAVNGGLGRPRR